MFIGKPEGKSPPGRPTCRWEDIRMDLKETEGGKEWTGFIWLRIGTRGRFL
jgi:hypothetical protein